MHIEVIASVAEAAQYSLQDTTVVVIDVLRATTVITVALQNGALEIYPAVEVEQARDLARTLTSRNVLLAGERQALRIPGFDLGNSPREFIPERVRDTAIVLTTSNGTRALEAARSASTVLIGCLLNAAAVALHLENCSSVSLLCSGTANHADISDCLAAAAIIHALSARGVALELGDFARLCLAYFAADRCLELIQDSFHGQRLVQLGLEEDLGFCSRLNISNAVPRFVDDRIVLIDEDRG